MGGFPGTRGRVGAGTSGAPGVIRAGLVLVAVLGRPAMAGGAGLRGQSAPGPGAADAPAAVRFEVVPEGSEARYRVREQLAGLDFPNDAVGVTDQVRGAIAFDENGAVIRDRSRFVVDLAGLKSDRDRRDGFVRRRILETDRYPEAVLVPTGLRGLTFPLPGSGVASFQLVGDFTVHGVTRSTVWDVDATFSGGEVRGTASTAFTFEDLDLEKPRVPLVLGVEDDIRLELDIHLVAAEGGGLP